MHDRHVDPDALRRLIAERGFTLVEFAERSGVSYTHLKKIRAGRRQPSDRCAAVIARHLAVAVAAFTVAGPAPRPSPPTAPSRANISSNSEQEAA